MKDVVGKMVSVAKECGNAVERRERIAPVMRRTAELDKYVDPAFSEDYGGVAPDVKADVVLAREQRLRDAERMLARVKEAKEAALDGGDAFESASSLQPRLLELTRLHLEQDVAGRGLEAETVELASQYNQVVEAVSRALIGYDRAIAKAEADVERDKERKRAA